MDEIWKHFLYRVKVISSYQEIDVSGAETRLTGPSHDSAFERNIAIFFCTLSYSMYFTIRIGGRVGRVGMVGAGAGAATRGRELEEVFGRGVSVGDPVSWHNEAVRYSEIVILRIDSCLPMVGMGKRAVGAMSWLSVGATAICGVSAMVREIRSSASAMITTRWLRS